MITFASLFLGLVLGTREVAVNVGGDVAAVELRLDGAQVGVMRGAPWTLDCPFGSELEPHHLEAIAYDSSQRELGRVSQWINLPLPQAVATMFLEPKVEGEPRIARLTWESAAGAQPVSLTVTLDGEVLQATAVADPHRIVLPPVDERQFHLLSAELEFEDRVRSRVDLTFGGAYVDAVQTEITAITLVSTKPNAPRPTLAAARGWFRKGDQELQPLAIERGNPEIVFVIDRGFPHLVVPGSRYKTPKGLKLDGSERFRFLTTIPEHSQGVETTFDLFPISSAFVPPKGDLYSLLTRLVRPQTEGERRPISAVAVAGLAAHESRLRRAVVLVAGPNPHADVDIAPEMVRRYLGRLGVPLFVWDPESRSAPQVAAWADVSRVGTFDQLADALTQVRSAVDRQWIVWIEGRHLPQEVSLSADAEGFVLLHDGPGA